MGEKVTSAGPRYRGMGEISGIFRGMTVEKAFKKLEVRMALLSSLGIAVLTTVPRVLDHVFTAYYDTLVNYIVIFLFNLLMWYANIWLIHWGEQEMTERRRFRRYPVARFCVTSVMACLVMYPLTPLLKIAIDSQLSRSDFLVYRGFLINLVIFTIVYAVNLLRQFKFAELENQELKTQNLDAQLNQLRNQLNPHFLFNSLNTLKSMVKEGNPGSVEYIVRASELYRYLLQNQTTDLVTVDEELKVVNALVFVLEQRFEHNLLVHIDVAEETLDRKIPPFAIQLLIENAIKHNIVSHNKPLTIDIHNNGSESLEIVNTLQRKRSVETTTRIGLRNLDKRYQLIGSRPIGIEEDEHRFRVRLPLF
jgi:two-component system LytT family sensor kinase